MCESLMENVLNKEYWNRKEKYSNEKIKEFTESELKKFDFYGNIHNIDYIEFEIGGFFDGYRNIEMIFYDNHIMCYERPCSYHDELVVSKVNLDKFINLFSRLNIETWKLEYNNNHILDGTQWHFIVGYKNIEKRIYIYGSNDFPDNFNALEELFEKNIPYVERVYHEKRERIEYEDNECSDYYKVLKELFDKNTEDENVWILW